MIFFRDRQKKVWKSVPSKAFFLPIPSKFYAKLKIFCSKMINFDVVFDIDKTKKRDVSKNISSFCGAERARTVDLLRDRQAF